jgi:hypothetical protein
VTNPSPEQLFRQAAEAEGGVPVSAGARVVHVRLALDAGRAITVDLSQVPADGVQPLSPLSEKSSDSARYKG